MDQDDKNNKGIDLSGALKDSGAGAKFKEYRTPRSYYSRTPKIIQWVMRYSGGLVKDEKQASYAILGFVVLAIIITLVLIFGGGGPKTIPRFREDIEPEVRIKLPPGVFETISSKYDK